jgi:hypothetical protein
MAAKVSTQQQKHTQQPQKTAKTMLNPQETTLFVQKFAQKAWLFRLKARTMGFKVRLAALFTPSLRLFT